ncbi:hypothetical protein [Bradyrhizobium sp. NC92]|uniref:hypothetical protein n=1 Tax=Bradyrhizobium sp. (strain NC92) TaxID=55395 RepID=UPI0021AA8850|nr:hypothetical protein [Bradyrhizobium sp. NC92]UWU67949.1 hypothetical protein N2602_32970 [Bradyrhizobium sp. NC92]
MALEVCEKTAFLKDFSYEDRSPSDVLPNWTLGEEANPQTGCSIERFALESAGFLLW